MYMYVHVAGALEALQRLHIIHRDIKPQNLLLSFPTAAITGSAGSSGRRGDRLIRDATIKLGESSLREQRCVCVCVCVQRGAG